MPLQLPRLRLKAIPPGNEDDLPFRSIRGPRRPCLGGGTGNIVVDDEAEKERCEDGSEVNQKAVRFQQAQTESQAGHGKAFRFRHGLSENQP